MSEWKTIDSAPKDGTRVLIWITYAREGSGALVGVWHVANFRRPIKPRDQGHGEWCDDFGEPYCADPAHWQPLPAPPSDNDAQVAGPMK